MTRRNTLRAVAGVLALGLLLMANPTEAGQTTFAVTKAADTNDGACTVDDCSLREAIIAANAAGNADVNVPAGTYRLTIRGRGEELAATGDLDIRKGVNVRGAGARKTILEGRGIDRILHTPFQNTSTPFTVNVVDMKITGGDARAGPGGGILHDADDATMSLTKTVVTGNESASGGGIMVSRGPLNIARSTISGNRAPGGLGGGILDSGGGANLENTTVSGNRSKFGGGITTYESLRATDSTIAFNRANQPGGGIFVNSGSTTFKNAIVSNNQSASAGFDNCNTANITSEGNNLEKGTSCGFDQSTDKNADPKLGPLDDNGGPTNTHAVLRRSPAIDAGGMPFPDTDQRGVDRPQRAANDIGAFEKKPRRK